MAGRCLAQGYSLTTILLQRQWNNAIFTSLKSRCLWIANIAFRFVCQHYLSHSNYDGPSVEQVLLSFIPKVAKTKMIPTSLYTADAVCACDNVSTFLSIHAHF
jgi:hypothetical protein